MAFQCLVLVGAVLALQAVATNVQKLEAALQEAEKIQEAYPTSEHSQSSHGWKRLAYLQTDDEDQEPDKQIEFPSKKHLRATTKVAAESIAKGFDAAAETTVAVSPLEEEMADGPSLKKMLDPAAWKSTSKDGESAMEKQLTDLMMAGGDLGATPFGKSVAEISRVIKDEMMGQVLKAHKVNQEQLYTENKEIEMCGGTKNSQVKLANVKRDKYVKTSGLHKTCRAAEAGKYSEKTETFKEMSDKDKIKQLKCHAFAITKQQLTNQNDNGQIVKKGGGEGDESYVHRLTMTMCGKPYTVGKGGAGRQGFLDVFLIAKEECQIATNEYTEAKKTYETALEEYNDKMAECDSLQDQMDGASCKRATEMKDACETYAECYFDRHKAHLATVKMVKTEETDRKAEWRGLQRMKCLMEAFSDGKVKNSEIKVCKNKKHTTDHLTIVYPPYKAFDKCSVPNLYPSTPAYKLAEFAPLPAFAKGREDANECTGVIEINEVPAKGSPKTCKCERVTLNGPYSAGPIVKCTDCKPARRSTEANSCPEGTKLFSPRSESDWKTILSSAEEIQDPHFVVDVTNPKRGCGYCNKKAMNSASPQGTRWHTSDGSPWWLRSTTYKEPNADGQPNCYLGVNLNGDEKNITFSYDGCKHNAKSYYCQLKEQSIKPKTGSPEACACKPVVLTGPYSAGSLLKCTNCLDVSKSMQKNSCPTGTKIFSPATSQDWKTFLASAKPLRSPHWIIDVTRPQNGCGGCKNHVMNSKVAAQATWRTADSSAWWLRDSKYSEPNGDYKANCYMDLFKTPFSESSIMFNDGNCNYHSDAYYCQPVKKRKGASLVEVNFNESSFWTN